MGTLYIDRKEMEVRLDGDALAFYCEGVREGCAPVKPLKRVVFCGKVMIDSSVLHKLADENISVLFLSGKKQQFKGMLHGRLHNNGILRLSQYEKSRTSFPFEWARKLMLRKITGQREMLSHALETRPDLRLEMTSGIAALNGVIESVAAMSPLDVDSLRGFEGGAAASYFAAYINLFPGSLNFSRRVRRPPTDPVNALLSLTYTLLHYEAVREIEVIGLDPTIGFYHEFDYGRESLACDIMELFRPQADRRIWELFRDRVFTARDFTEGVERPGCYLKKEGRKTYYALYEEWAADIRRTLVEEVRGLAKEIMDGNEGIIPE